MALARNFRANQTLPSQRARQNLVKTTLCTFLRPPNRQAIGQGQQPEKLPDSITHRGNDSQTIAAASRQHFLQHAFTGFSPAWPYFGTHLAKAKAFALEPFNHESCCGPHTARQQGSPLNNVNLALAEGYYLAYITKSSCRSSRHHH